MNWWIDESHYPGPSEHIFDNSIRVISPLKPFSITSYFGENPYAIIEVDEVQFYTLSIGILVNVRTSGTPLGVISELKAESVDASSMRYTVKVTMAGNYV